MYTIPQDNIYPQTVYLNRLTFFFSSTLIQMTRLLCMPHIQSIHSGSLFKVDHFLHWHFFCTFFVADTTDLHAPLFSINIRFCEFRLLYENLLRGLPPCY